MHGTVQAIYFHPPVLLHLGIQHVLKPIVVPYKQMLQFNEDLSAHNHTLSADMSCAVTETQL